MVKCDVCFGTNTELIIRPGGLRWPYAWQCNDCGAAVGCRIDTYEPGAPLASGKVRMLRRLAHANFDRIWMVGFMSRERAKRWAAENLNIDQEFHISHCNIQQLLQVMRFSKEYFEKHIKGLNPAQLKEKYADRRERKNRKTAKRNALEKERRKRRRS